MTTPLLAARDFRDSAIALSGTADYEMYSRFREQLAGAPDSNLVLIELSTLGGEAHARQMERATRKTWHSTVQQQHTKTLDAPSWLWTSVVARLERNQTWSRSRQQQS